MSNLRDQLRSKIVSASDIKEEIIEIPEWDNAKILLKGLSGKQRAEMMTSAVDTSSKAINFSKVYPDLLIMGCYEPEEKTKLFENGDRKMLEGKSASIVERIAYKLLDLSGLSENAKEKIEKN